MTPHPGEMARLADMTTKDVQARRLDVARRFAEKHHVTLVLKGARTLIAHPDGSVAVNTSGNPAMAKGGSGDMLTAGWRGCWDNMHRNLRGRWRRRCICMGWPRILR